MVPTRNPPVFWLVVCCPAQVNDLPKLLRSRELLVCSCQDVPVLRSEGEDDSWDFGSGAGFYLNATQPKWKQYRMYDYVVKELPSVLKQFKQLDLSKV